MGISINTTVASDLKEGLELIAALENRELITLPVAVRTERGIDARFYLDIEDGRLLITPESFYKTKEEK